MNWQTAYSNRRKQHEFVVQTRPGFISPSWRRPLAIDETFVTTMRVWLFDLDINRHVTNGRYYSMADIAWLIFYFAVALTKWPLAKAHYQ